MSEKIINMKMKDGKLEFVRYVLNVCLSQTNDELAELNMKTLHFYIQSKLRYPDEFKLARHIFEKHFKTLMKKISKEILDGVWMEN